MGTGRNGGSGREEEWTREEGGRGQNEGKDWLLEVKKTWEEECMREEGGRDQDEGRDLEVEGRGRGKRN